MTDYDPTDEHEPYDVDELGMGGVSKSVVVDVIQSIAGREHHPFQDGTRPHKTHSAVVKVRLAPHVELETVARVVYALEQLNLYVNAKEDERFSDGVNPRGLGVNRKLYDEDRHPDVSPWWDTVGVDRGEYADE